MTGPSTGCLVWRVLFMGTFLPRGRFSSLGVCFPPFQILWLGGDRCLLFLLGHLGLDFSFQQSSPSTGLFHSSLVFEVEASWLLPCAPPRGGFPLVARAPDPVPLPSSLPLPALSIRSPFPETHLFMRFPPGGYEAWPPLRWSD